MAIYAAKPVFSESEKRLLKLMAKLLLEYMDPSSSKSNLGQGTIALIDAEAVELAELLERLVDSKEFREASIFVEGFALPGSVNKAQLKEIFLAARKRKGRSRSLSSFHWGYFQERLGIVIDPVRGGGADTMSLEYFEKMERRLLGEAGLNYRVIDFVMKVVAAQIPVVERIRLGKANLPQGSVERPVRIPLEKWRALRGREISSTRVAATITLVADMSVMFTSRDWSVAGTLSTMAGAFACVADTSN